MADTSDSVGSIVFDAIGVPGFKHVSPTGGGAMLKAMVKLSVGAGFRVSTITRTVWVPPSVSELARLTVSDPPPATSEPARHGPVPHCALTSAIDRPSSGPASAP